MAPIGITELRVQLQQWYANPACMLTGLPQNAGCALLLAETVLGPTYFSVLMCGLNPATAATGTSTAPTRPDARSCTAVRR